MRDFEEMHYYLWEAIRDEAVDMARRGILSCKVAEDFDFIDKSIKRQGCFSEKLRKMACRLEVKVLSNEAVWQRMIEDEMREEIGYAVEMHRADLRL